MSDDVLLVGVECLKYRFWWFVHVTLSDLIRCWPDMGFDTPPQESSRDPVPEQV